MNKWPGTFVILIAVASLALAGCRPVEGNRVSDEGTPTRQAYIYEANVMCWGDGAQEDPKLIKVGVNSFETMDYTGVCGREFLTIEINGPKTEKDLLDKACVEVSLPAGSEARVVRNAEGTRLGITRREIDGGGFDTIDWIMGCKGN